MICPCAIGPSDGRVRHTALRLRDGKLMCAYNMSDAPASCCMVAAAHRHETGWTWPCGDSRARSLELYPSSAVSVGETTAPQAFACVSVTGKEVPHELEKYYGNCHRHICGSHRVCWVRPEMEANLNPALDGKSGSPKELANSHAAIYRHALGNPESFPIEPVGAHVRRRRHITATPPELSRKELRQGAWECRRRFCPDHYLGYGKLIPTAP